MAFFLVSYVMILLQLTKKNPDSTSLGPKLTTSTDCFVKVYEQEVKLHFKLSTRGTHPSQIMGTIPTF